MEARDSFDDLFDNEEENFQNKKNIMASPQIENGYIKIANELFDALCRIRIPGEVRQIFDLIIRKTYGYNKKKDVISYSQFVEFTGISRQASIKATRKLLQMNLISVTKNGNRITYEINKDFEQWKMLPKKVMPNIGDKGVTQNGNDVLPILVTKVLPNTSHTKDNKDNFKYKEKDMRDTPTIWRSIFPNKTPGQVEIKFVEELREKFDVNKASQILFNLRELNFNSIRTMREALNDDGSIKPKENNGTNPEKIRRSPNYVTKEEYESELKSLYEART